MNGFSDIPPVCPTCGNFAKQAPGKFGIKSTCCGLWSWGGKPLVDRETHFNRINAHNVFDKLWKEGYMTRGNAYQWLQQRMGMQEQPHMAEMSASQCAKVMSLVNGYLSSHSPDKKVIAYTEERKKKKANK